MLSNRCLVYTFSNLTFKSINLIFCIKIFPKLLTVCLMQYLTMNLLSSLFDGTPSNDKNRTESRIDFYKIITKLKNEEILRIISNQKYFYQVIAFKTSSKDITPIFFTECNTTVL